MKRRSFISALPVCVLSIDSFFKDNSDQGPEWILRIPGTRLRTTEHFIGRDKALRASLEERFDFVGFENTAQYNHLFDKARRRIFNDPELKYFKRNRLPGFPLLECTEKGIPVFIYFNIPGKRFYHIHESVYEKGHSPDRNFVEKLFSSLGFPADTKKIDITRTIGPMYSSIVNSEDEKRLRYDGPGQSFMINLSPGSSDYYVTEPVPINPRIRDKYFQIFTKLTGMKVD